MRHSVLASTLVIALAASGNQEVFDHRRVLVRQDVAMVNALALPGLEPGAHGETRKWRQPDGVMDAMIAGVRWQSHNLERVHVDMKGMNAVGIVNDAPFLRGSNFYRRIDYPFLV